MATQHLDKNKPSIKALYHVSQESFFNMCFDVRPGYLLQPSELKRTILVTSVDRVYEIKTTGNGIKLMSGGLAAEAMQSHKSFVHATYLIVIL